MQASSYRTQRRQSGSIDSRPEKASLNSITTIKEEKFRFTGKNKCNPFRFYFADVPAYGACRQSIALPPALTVPSVRELTLPTRSEVLSQFSSIQKRVQCDADVIIDFSHPSVLTDLLCYAMHNQLPDCPLFHGYSDSQLEEIKRAASVIPVFKSGNMSLGINLMIEFAKRAATVLGEAFDIEIIEKHHNRKLDAPSGTALMLAEGVSSVLPGEASYVYDRHSRRMPRSKTEIGIHSVRGGTIVGEHEIYLLVRRKRSLSPIRLNPVKYLPAARLTRRSL